MRLRCLTGNIPRAPYRDRRRPRHCGPPRAAFAEPELKCNFDGKKTVVLIVNPDATNKQCNYSCRFAVPGGAASVSGSVTVTAGETRTVDEDTQNNAVTGVQSSSLNRE
jgi:hypothetical protein